MHSTELIVAMDIPHAEGFKSILDIVPNSVRWLKIGLELFCCGGPSVIDVARVESARNAAVTPSATPTPWTPSGDRRGTSTPTCRS